MEGRNVSKWEQDKPSDLADHILLHHAFLSLILPDKMDKCSCLLPLLLTTTIFHKD